MKGARGSCLAARSRSHDHVGVLLTVLQLFAWGSAGSNCTVFQALGGWAGGRQCSCARFRSGSGEEAGEEGVWVEFNLYTLLGGTEPAAGKQRQT